MVPRSFSFARRSCEPLGADKFLRRSNRPWGAKATLCSHRAEGAQWLLPGKAAVTAEIVRLPSVTLAV